MKKTNKLPREVFKYLDLTCDLINFKYVRNFSLFLKILGVGSHVSFIIFFFSVFVINFSYLAYFSDSAPEQHLCLFDGCGTVWWFLYSMVGLWLLYIIYEIIQWGEGAYR